MKKNKDIFDRIMELPGIRIFQPFYKKYKEVLLYLFFGGLTTVVSIAAFAAGQYQLHMNPLVANIFSWILAVLFAYVTNRIWVFESSAANTKELLGEMAGFFGGRLATLGMEEVILFLGITLCGINSMIVKVIAQFLVVIGNYFISKLLVFREKN